MVNLIGFGFVRIGPVRQSALFDARENLVELGLTHQERVVLRLDLALGIDEVQR
jgi:hypothetical protein